VTEERGPHFAFPSLYGAPAYARPPKPVADAVRPLDPDDLPLEVERTEEEWALLAQFGTAAGSNGAGGARAMLHGRVGNKGAGAQAGSYRATDPTAASQPVIPGRRFRLRAPAGRSAERGR